MPEAEAKAKAGGQAGCRALIIVIFAHMQQPTIDTAEGGHRVDGW